MSGDPAIPGDTRKGAGQWASPDARTPADAHSEREGGANSESDFWTGAEKRADCSDDSCKSPVSQTDNRETVNPLLDHMANTFMQCLELSKAKNAGYASDANPLANFESADKLGVPVPVGIAIRMSDKWARLCRLLKTGKNPLPSESVTDTLQDLINYAAILLYALEVK